MKRSSKRRGRVKYVDPVTGLTEYRYVEKVIYRYEDEEKAPIVIEFLTGETSAEKMVEKYHICSVQTLTFKIEVPLFFESSLAASGTEAESGLKFADDKIPEDNNEGML